HRAFLESADGRHDLAVNSQLSLLGNLPAWLYASGGPALGCGCRDLPLPQRFRTRRGFEVLNTAPGNCGAVVGHDHSARVAWAFVSGTRNGSLVDANDDLS